MTVNRCLFLFLFVLSYNFLSAQSDVLTGSVLDAETKESLSFASVFFNSTTNGTITDNNGNFTISVNPLYKELVVSFLGYETITFMVDPTALNKKYIFELNQASEIIEEVKVEASRSKQWYENLEFFKENFIGYSEFAQKLKIENEKDLFFNFDLSTGIFTAKARAPLKIKNESLGYDLEYLLVDFYFDTRKKYIFYQGYPKFTEMKGSNRKKKKWKKNRTKSFLGSPTHFMKSIIDNKVEAEGFRVNKIYRKPNPNRPSKEEIAWARAQLKGRKEIKLNSNNQDSVSLILRRARNPEFIDYLDKNLHPVKQDLKTAGDLYLLNFTDLLQVIYKKEKADKNFRPSGQLFAKKNKGPQTTVIHLLNSDGAIINSMGQVESPKDLLYDGYWPFEKIADLLPLDYVPEKKK